MYDITKIENMFQKTFLIFEILVPASEDGRRLALSGGTVTLRLHNPSLSGNIEREGDAYVDVRRTYCSYQPLCWLL